MTLLPLPVHPAPTPAQVKAIRVAKTQLNLSFQVTIVQAVPGSGLRTLVFEPPPWLCDYALVTRLDALPAALAWVLSDAEDPRATLIIDELRSVFGPGVREVGVHFE